MRVGLSVAGALLALGAAWAAGAQEDAPVSPRGAGPSREGAPGLGRLPARGSTPVEIPPHASPESWAPVEGVCRLTFDVTAYGRVVGSSIVADCTSPELVDPAIGIAAGWRYEPLVVDGEPRAQPGMSAQVRFRTPG